MIKINVTRQKLKFPLEMVENMVGKGDYFLGIVKSRNSLVNSYKEGHYKCIIYMYSNMLREMTKNMYSRSTVLLIRILICFQNIAHQQPLITIDLLTLYTTSISMRSRPVLIKLESVLNWVCAQTLVSLMLESVWEIILKRFWFDSRNNEIFYRSKVSPEVLPNENYPTTKFHGGQDSRSWVIDWFSRLQGSAGDLTANGHFLIILLLILAEICIKIKVNLCYSWFQCFYRPFSWF